MSWFTSPIKTGIGLLVGAALAWLLFFQVIPAYDRYRQRKNLALHQDAKQQVVNADTLTAQADTEQARVVNTERGYNTLIRSPQVRSNPVARTVADTSKKVIDSKDRTIKDLRGANAHLDSAVKDLESAGPPLPPRLIPYIDAGYGFSSRHRAVPVGRAGLDYRILNNLGLRGEVSYEPPPAGAEKQTPEFRGLIAAHITFK